MQKFVNFPYVHSIYIFWLNLHFLLPPYFDPDAFMHHALHVLDAPARTLNGALWSVHKYWMLKIELKFFCLFEFSVLFDTFLKLLFTFGETVTNC